MSHKVVRVLVVAVCLLAALPALHFHASCDIWPEDDAYITYRYVQNAMAGRGLVYNAGERVFGSSSPLYTVVLCSLKRFLPAVDIAALAVRSNVVPYLAAALL